MHQPNGRGKKQTSNRWLTQSFSFQSKTKQIVYSMSMGKGREYQNKLTARAALTLYVFSVGIFLLTSKATCNHANIEGTTFQRINHNCWAQLCTAKPTPPGELSLPCSRQDSQWSLLGRSNLKTASVEASSKQPSSKTPAGLLLPARSSEPVPGCLPSRSGAALALDAFWQRA